jgi:UDP-N-acetylglucosamine 2-epimerase
MQSTFLLALGDVTSTVAAARAGRLAGKRVLHYEGGLRCDCAEPEERNRVEADAVSDVIYATEPSAVTHLARERTQAAVVLVGNVMIDSLMFVHARAKASTFVRRRMLPHRGYILCTLHRVRLVMEHVRCQLICL